MAFADNTRIGEEFDIECVHWRARLPQGLNGDPLGRLKKTPRLASKNRRGVGAFQAEHLSQTITTATVPDAEAPQFFEGKNKIGQPIKRPAQQDQVQHDGLAWGVEALGLA